MSYIVLYSFSSYKNKSASLLPENPFTSYLYWNHVVCIVKIPYV